SVRYLLMLRQAILATSRHFFGLSFFFLLLPPPRRSPLFPYTTLFRSVGDYGRGERHRAGHRARAQHGDQVGPLGPARAADLLGRSEEHTSELQSRFDLVCRLLLEKKKNQ